MHVSKSNTTSCHGLERVYDIRFLDAVKQGWNGDARTISVFLFSASGIWPYCKNLILLAIWFLPMRHSARKKILLWIKAAGKWSYVDVFIMVLLNATLNIDKRLSTNYSAVLKAFSGNAVLTFCIAASIALVQAEWISHVHESVKLNTVVGRLKQRRDFFSAPIQGFKLTVIPLLCGVLGIYILKLDLVSLELTGVVALLPGRNTYVYSVEDVLGSFFSRPCSEGFMIQEWILFIFFGSTVFFIPLLVCFLIICLQLVDRYRIPITRTQTTRISKAIETLFSFACVDVFVISYFIVTLEISKLIGAVGSRITSMLGASVNVSMNCRRGIALPFLIILMVLFWFTQYLFTREYTNRDKEIAHVGDEPTHLERIDEDQPLFELQDF